MIHEHRNTRMRNRNLYVLTGGPGGGKSTVLDILDGMGYHTVREAGRKIIRSQAETGGNAVPWADTARYARLMSLQSRNDFEKHADLGEPCFFDRGIVDVWGYTTKGFSSSPFGKKSMSTTPKGNRARTKPERPAES